MVVIPIEPPLKALTLAGVNIRPNIIAQKPRFFNGTFARIFEFTKKLRLSPATETHKNGGAKCGNFTSKSGWTKRKCASIRSVQSAASGNTRVSCPCCAGARKCWNCLNRESPAGSDRRHTTKARHRLFSIWQDFSICAGAAANGSATTAMTANTTAVLAGNVKRMKVVRNSLLKQAHGQPIENQREQRDISLCLLTDFLSGRPMKGGEVYWDMWILPVRRYGFWLTEKSSLPVAPTAGGW